jgi:ABC-type nitrate/sulfonate/bicarbonate transport system substrate-binding protein
MSLLTRLMRGLAVISLVSAAFMAAAAGPLAAQELQKVRFGLSSTSLAAGGVRFAKELGLFEKHGLSAEVIPMDSGSVATMGLISGSVDFSSSGPSDVILARARGQDALIVQAIYRGNPGVIVLSKKVVDRLGVSASAPVEARLKAMDGLSIATPSATSTYTTSTKAVQTVGANVKFSYMAQPAMIAALESGAIDGFHASSPNWTIPVLRGTAVIWLSGPGGDFPKAFTPVNAVTIHTTSKYASANPGVVAKVRAVFDDLAKAFNDRPADVKAAISRQFPDLDPKALDLIYKIEAPAFATVKPVTAADMAQEIAFVKLSGMDLPAANLDPAAMILR